MQDDVAVGDGASRGQGRCERSDRVVADGENDDLDVTDPSGRGAACRQRQGCWYAFLVSPVQVDGVSRLGQSQSQSDSRATGPDESDRAGRLSTHRLRSGDGRCVLASVSRSCGDLALSAKARARLICSSSAIRRRNSAERPKT